MSSKNSLAPPSHLGTFVYRYEGGLVYELNFDSDTKLRWRCLEGDDKGHAGSEESLRVAIRPGVHFLSWVEKDGLVVTQVIDYDAGTVNCVLVVEGKRIVLQGSVTRL